MKLEDHPKALLALLVFALSAGVIGASRSIRAGPASFVSTGHGACLVEAPRLAVDFAALPAALADGIENGTVSLESPATLALLRELDAIK